jgi:hypothetical protein
VFAGTKVGQPIALSSFGALLRRKMKRENVTAHGFRSCFADWATERTAYLPEVREMALVTLLATRPNRLTGAAIYSPNVLGSWPGLGVRQLAAGEVNQRRPLQAGGITISQIIPRRHLHTSSRMPSGGRSKYCP